MYKIAIMSICCFKKIPKDSQIVGKWCKFSRTVQCWTLSKNGQTKKPRIGSQYVTKAPNKCSLNGKPFNKKIERTDGRTNGWTANVGIDARSDYIMPQI